MHRLPVWKLYPHHSIGEYVRSEMILIKDKWFRRYRDMRTGEFITRRMYARIKNIVAYNNRLNAFRRARPEIAREDAIKMLKEYTEELKTGIIDKEDYHKIFYA